MVGVASRATPGGEPEAGVLAEDARSDQGQPGQDPQPWVPGGSAAGGQGGSPGERGEAAEHAEDDEVGRLHPAAGAQAQGTDRLLQARVAGAHRSVDGPGEVEPHAGGHPQDQQGPVGAGVRGHHAEKTPTFRARPDAGIVRPRRADTRNPLDLASRGPVRNGHGRLRQHQGDRSQPGARGNAVLTNRPYARRRSPGPRRRRDHRPSPTSPTRYLRPIVREQRRGNLLPHTSIHCGPPSAAPIAPPRCARGARYPVHRVPGGRRWASRRS